MTPSRLNPPKTPYFLTDHTRTVSLRRWKHVPEVAQPKTRRRGNKIFTTYSVWYFQDRSGKRSKWNRRKSLRGFLYRITRVEVFRKPKAEPEKPPPGPWDDAQAYLRERLASYGLPWNAWAEQRDKLLPSQWPLQWRHRETGFMIRNRDGMTPTRLGSRGRKGADVSADLEWWSVVRIPADWAEVITAGQVGTPLALSSTTTKGAEPVKKSKRKVYALIGLPHHWEPPPGEYKAAARAKSSGVVFKPAPVGYTMAGHSEHMHERIWSKRAKAKMVRWKAHIRQYEASYNKRFNVSVTFEPVEFLGYAVRMWL